MEKQQVPAACAPEGGDKENADAIGTSLSEKLRVPHPSRGLRDPRGPNLGMDVSQYESLGAPGLYNNAS
jgi:hypothetical protein